jgi:hypothetical protein
LVLITIYRVEERVFDDVFILVLDGLFSNARLYGFVFEPKVLFILAMLVYCL